MAKKVTIVELDIDTDKLISKQADIIKQQEELKKQRKELNKEIAQGNEVTEEQAKTLAKIDSELTDLNKQYRTNKNVITESTTAIKGYTDALDEEVKTVDQAAKNNKELRKIRNQINADTKEGAQAIEDLNKKIDKNTDFIKTNSSQLEKQKINIGNYQSATEGLGDALGGLTSGTGSATDAFKTFGKALLANPIGAIVAALGLLIGAFASTQEGMNKIKELSAGLTAVLNVLWNTVQDLATGGFEVLSKIIKLDFEGALKSASQVAEQFADNTENIGEKIKEAAKEGMAIERLRQQYVELNRAGELAIANMEMQRATLEGLRDDATASFAQRTNAAVKLAETNAKIAKEQEKIALRELKLVTKNNDLIRKSGQKLTNEQKDQYKEAQIAFLEAQTQRIEIENENFREINQLRQDEFERDLDILIDGFDNYKTIKEQEIALEERTFEEKLSLIQELEEEGERTFNKQIETIQAQTDAEINANDLLRESNAVLLNEKIRSLGLSEINEGRLLEVIRERRMVENDLSLQSVEIAKQEADRKLAIERQRIEDENALEQAQYDTSQILRIAEQEQIVRDFQNTILAKEKILLANNEFEEENAKELAERNLEIQTRTIEEERKNRLDALNQALEDRINSGSELVDYTQEEKDEIVRINAVADAELVRANEEKNTSINKAEEEAAQQRNEIIKQSVAEQVESIGGYVSQVLDILGTLNDASLSRAKEREEKAIESAESEFQNETKLLQQSLDRGKSIWETEEQFLKRQENLKNQIAEAEIERDQKIKDARNEAIKAQYEADKREYNLKIAQIITDTAVGVAKALAIIPPPLNIAQAGLVTAAGAAALISAKANPVPPPVYLEKGGMLEVGGNRHVSGGTMYYGDDGNVLEAEKGEMIGVLNRGASSAFMAFNNAYRNGGNFEDRNINKRLDKINETIANKKFNSYNAFFEDNGKKLIRAQKLKEKYG